MVLKHDISLLLLSVQQLENKIRLKAREVLIRQSSLRIRTELLMEQWI